MAAAPLIVMLCTFTPIQYSVYAFYAMGQPGIIRKFNVNLFSFCRFLHLKAPIKFVFFSFFGTKRAVCAACFAL